MMAATGRYDDPLLPPGFRFYPTEEELLGFYLRHRLAGTRPDVERFIPVVDIYSYHPRDLQAMAGVANVNDTEQWFFFCPRAEREVHGGRPARTTPSGYWKATGSPSWVFSSSDNRVVGEKRTMVFYQGRAPAGTKTRWKMNEYKLAVVAADPPLPLRDVQLRNEFSVCRVYISTGTLRSFDRRPLNYGVDRALHHLPHHHRQQQQQLLVLPPTVAPNTSSINNQQQVAASNDGQTMMDDCHDSSAASSESRVTMVIDDNAAAAMDYWDSMVVIPPPPATDDGLMSFSAAEDLARAVIWSQI